MAVTVPRTMPTVPNPDMSCGACWAKARAAEVPGLNGKVLDLVGRLLHLGTEVRRDDIAGGLAERVKRPLGLAYGLLQGLGVP